MVVERISDRLEVRKKEISSSFIKPETKESVEVELDERHSPLPKATGFALTYPMGDNKQVTKLTKLGGKVDRADKRVVFSFNTAAARTSFRNNNKVLLSKLKESVELDEEVYTFKSPSDVKKFVSAATEAGVKKNLIKVKGKSIDIKGIKDKDMIQMLGLVAKDMKGTVSESISNILDGEDGEQVVFEDGSSRFITKNEANSLAEIHDSLNSDEREEFINKISESSDIVEIILGHIN